MPAARALAILSACLLLAACDRQAAPAGNDDLKRTLDQLVGIERETSGATKEAASATRSTVEEVRKLTARVESLEKTMAATLAGQKRGAIYLPLEAETVCDNDALCNNTARAVCNRVNYPNGIPSRFSTGTRPMLNSVVCYD